MITHVQTRTGSPTRTNTRIRRAPEHRVMGRAAHGPGATAQHLQRTLGNRATQALLQRMIWTRASQPAAAIQAKLEVGAVDDPLEREADATAERVMRMKDGACCPGCANGGSCAGIGGTVHRAPTAGASAATTLPADLEEDVQRLTSGGEPLPGVVRTQLEPRFGADLSGVRVHRDATAAESSAALGARAWALGNHIAFGAGQWAPGTGAGDRLLAHELAHTQQQAGGAFRLQRQPALVLPLPGERLTVISRLEAGEIRLDPGEQVIVVDWPAEGVMATVELPIPYLHAGQPFQVLKSLLQRRVVAGAGPAADVVPNRAQAEGVTFEKWSPDLEAQYRRWNEIAAADGLRRCRREGGTACTMVLTLDEALAMFTGLDDQASAATGNAPAGPPAAAAPPMVAGGLRVAPGGPGPAGPTPPWVYNPPSVAPSPGPAPGGWAWERPPPVRAPVPTTPSTPVTPTPGPGAGAAVGVSRVALAAPPLILAAYFAVAFYELGRWGAFQTELMRRGYIILIPPRSLCMRGCHSAAPEPARFPERPSPFKDFPPFEPSPFERFPPFELGRRQRREPRPMPEDWVDPRTDERREPPNPCDQSPLHECSSLGYPFDSFVTALADLQTGRPDLETQRGTEPSKSGNCFRDGQPRAPSEALASGATHTTYRIPGVSGAEGVVASIVCCRCCVPPAVGAILPSFKDRSAIVKERR